MLLRIVQMIGLSSVLLLEGCAMQHANLKEGIESFRVQNYRQAFVHLKPEAEKGQLDAEYAVGYMYYYGQGVVEDRVKACGWITRAAKAGQPDAVLALKRIQRMPRNRRCPL
jgi:TPR repeat protein